MSVSASGQTDPKSHPNLCSSPKQPGRPSVLINDTRRPSTRAEAKKDLASPQLIPNAQGVRNRPNSSTLKSKTTVQPNDSRAAKKPDLSVRPVRPAPPVAEWLSKLQPSFTPEEGEDLADSDDLDELSWEGTLSGLRSESVSEMVPTISRNAKNATYRNSNYKEELSARRSFLRPSAEGLIKSEIEFCKKLLGQRHPVPSGSMFEENHFKPFFWEIRDGSEARIYLDLHPLLVPAASNLFIRGDQDLQHLVDGYNNSWAEAVPFYGPRPQPDHTVGFRLSAFTDKQQARLGSTESSNSFYLATRKIYFPFLTSEVKCGNQPLDCADNANGHSMTVALRGVVDLLRRVGREKRAHRRILGFSISHDSNTIRLYAHYPEIDKLGTCYYRHTIKEFCLEGSDESIRWLCYRFTYSIYKTFAPILLQMITEAIELLPDVPIPTSAPTAVDEVECPASESNVTSQIDVAVGGLSTKLDDMQQALERVEERLEEQAEEQSERVEALESLMNERLGERVEALESLVNERLGERGKELDQREVRRSQRNQKRG